MNPNGKRLDDGITVEELANRLIKSGFTEKTRSILIIDSAGAHFLHIFLQSLVKLNAGVRCTIVTPANRELPREAQKAEWSVVRARVGTEGNLRLDRETRKSLKRDRYDIAYMLTVGGKPRLSELSSFGLRARAKYFLFEDGSRSGLQPGVKYQAVLIAKIMEHVLDVTVTLGGFLLLMGYCWLLRLSRKKPWK